MQSVRLSSGTIHYRDSGGDAPPVVFVHGALVNGELWSEVAAALGARCRCIVPDWPLGSHREALRPGADLTPPGVARLVAEFLEALDLEDVLLVGNDSGGALCQLVAAAHRARISSLVLTNCDALDVFPPRAYAYLKWLARSPGAMRAMTRTLYRWPLLARAPLAFGSLTRTRIPDALLRSWLEPAALDAGVRRDAAQFVRAMDAALTLGAAERLRDFAGPVLLLWGEDDPFFTSDLARRLAAVFPQARVALVPGARTFVPLDQPARVAAEVTAFLEGMAAPPAARPKALSTETTSIGLAPARGASSPQPLRC